MIPHTQGHPAHVSVAKADAVRARPTFLKDSTDELDCWRYPQTNNGMQSSRCILHITNLTASSTIYRRSCTPRAPWNRHVTFAQLPCSPDDGYLHQPSKPVSRVGCVEGFLRNAGASWELRTADLCVTVLTGWCHVRYRQDSASLPSGPRMKLAVVVDDTGAWRRLYLELHTLVLVDVGSRGGRWLFVTTPRFHHITVRSLKWLSGSAGRW